MLRGPALWLKVGIASTLAGAIANFLPTPVRAPALAAEAREPVWFDPSVVEPPRDSARAAVLAARARSEQETARALASAALAGAPESEAPLLRWLAADGARVADALDEAQELLLPLALSDHPLSPWAKLRVAEWLEVRDPGRALALLDALLVPTSELETWPGKSLAERLRARVLGKLGRREEAIAAFEQLLTQGGDGESQLQVLMPLAELLSERDDSDRLRALGLYRKVASQVPESRLAARAEELAATLLASLPADVALAYREPNLDQQLSRAEALLRLQRLTTASAQFLALEPRLTEQPELLCRARYGRAKALLGRRERGEGAALMVSVADACPMDADRRAWARYYAARAFSALGENEPAIAQYEALQDEAPFHRLADDALFRSAKVAAEMGNIAGAMDRLRALPERYPQGDMKPRAQIALAFHAAAQRDYALAVELLRESDGDEALEDVQGQAAYFLGRYLLDQRRVREAADAFATTARRFPLSYYGVSALSRLVRLDAKRAESLRPVLPQALPALRFPVVAELTQPGFLRATALLSVGEFSLGIAELRALGLLGKERPLELTFLCAALLQHAGAPHLALEAVRSRMPELLARTPYGGNLALYRVAYPLAFYPLIEESAAREGTTSAFVRAVAREESSFYPNAVSRAGAYGLVQILESTARAIAKGGLGLPASASSLRDPATNLAFGARFIATLTQAMGGELALVPAAYNAGPGITARWLAERSQAPFDRWIEEIPYDETRTYSRRVLQSYGIYQWLQTGQLPLLPEHLPEHGAQSVAALR